MDAKSLYTSLTADRTAQIIKEEVINSKIKFENVDIKELGICLRKNLGKQYVEENGYGDLLPKKIKPNKLS